MNVSVMATPVEPRWQTYLKAALFLLPAVICWQITRIFLFPKFAQIWQNAGGDGSEAQWLMNDLIFLVRYSGWILAAVVLGLILSEFSLGVWERYRRMTVGAMVLLLNAAVLAALTTMVILVLMAAPGLMQVN